MVEAQDGMAGKSDSKRIAFEPFSDLPTESAIEAATGAAAALRAEYFQEQKGYFAISVRFAS